MQCLQLSEKVHLRSDRVLFDWLWRTSFEFRDSLAGWTRKCNTWDPRNNPFDRWIIAGCQILTQLYLAWAPGQPDSGHPLASGGQKCDLGFSSALCCALPGPCFRPWVLGVFLPTVYGLHSPNDEVCGSLLRNKSEPQLLIRGPCGRMFGSLHGSLPAILRQLACLMAP